jgi:hypothetical protein
VGPFGHSNEPLGSIKGEEFLGFSRRTLIHGVCWSVGRLVSSVNQSEVMGNKLSDFNKLDVLTRRYFYVTRNILTLPLKL